MASNRPLRIAALIKQVPVAETLTLKPDGRLSRDGGQLEMNPYCRRAVSKGVELAGATGGTCTVVTLGPPQSEDVLREAIAWGADSGIHVCDTAFAGSDTLATARALVAVVEDAGPFDLILLGRNTIDGETGQVGPEVAQLLDLPFACGAHALEIGEDTLALELELDDGVENVVIDLPAVVSVAERLCDPCKVDPAGRALVRADRIVRLDASALRGGPWGDAGSPTKVGATRTMVHERQRLVLSGPVEQQVTQAVKVLISRGALESAAADSAVAALQPEGPERHTTSESPSVVVLAEPDRLQVTRELLGAARGLASQVAGKVVAFSAGPSAADDLAAAGADEVIELDGSIMAEDVADALIHMVVNQPPWAVVAPSTAFGREVAGRAAAATNSGLVGDAIGLAVVEGALVAAKPAFAGALVADISYRSAVQFATVRPGVLPPPSADASRKAGVTRTSVTPKGRIRTTDRRRTDDIEVLARADTVIGLGTGVVPDAYADLSPLAAILHAELAATRKVTDKGWVPRARQVGITGRAISPRLYIAMGLSGKFNHMVGVRAAGTILAINNDPDALVFDYSDVGIVADWRDALPLLEEALRKALHELEDGPTPG